MTLWNVTARHAFNDFLHLRGNIGTAFRLPDAWQLFGNDPCCTQGNPELEGEESFNVNLAIGASMPTRGGSLDSELIGFHRTVDNLIGSANGFRVNTEDEVTIAGGEFVFTYASENNWSTTIDLTVTDADADADGGAQQVPDIPEFAAKWLFGYRASGLPVGLNASVLYVGDVFSDVGGFFADGSFAEHGSYTVADVSGYYAFGAGEKHRIVVRLENAFDEGYATSVRRASSDAGETYLYENLGVPRTLHLTYRYTF